MGYLRFLSFIFLFLLTAGAFAQSSSELKRRREALSREIADLKRSQSKIVKDKRLSLKQINEIGAQIRLREEKINTISSEVRLLDKQISENASNVRSLQSQLEKLKQEYAAMVLFAFRNQSAYSKLMYIFASKDFNQGYKRLKYLQQFGESRQRRAKEIEDTQRELGIKITRLDRNKKEKSTLMHDQEKEKATLDKEKSNKAVQLSKLSKEEKKLRTQVSGKQQEIARLNRAIQNAINREIAEARRIEEARRKAEAAKEGNTAKPVAKGSGVLASTPEAARLSSDFLGNRGRLPWPVASGTIVSRFGTNSYGVNVKVENNGIDIRTAPSAGVRAVFSGDVTSVYDLGGQYVVLIRHGEYFTVYSNLRSASVSKGQKVSVKQTIGTVITDPVDGTTQLHFEVRKGAMPMNPESWLAN